MWPFSAVPTPLSHVGYRVNNGLDAGQARRPFVTQRFIPDVMTIRMLAAAEPERAANGADVGEVVIALRMVCMLKAVDCRPQ